ncbi:MAG: dTDP-4-dehydrorhamnose reductase [Calditrichaeota bacterium]|nr:MAG: dTDP-4-dehydrorhamnose reductase [Calditrichota bacterium]
MQILRPKVLITGAHGLLGSKLVRQLVRKYDVRGLVRQFRPQYAVKGVEYIEGDISKYKTVSRIIKENPPLFIINAAAYTQVDKSEVEREACWRTNVEGVENLARAAHMVDSRVVHISTDYVFDGKAGPYREEDRPNPLGYYGKSKLAGENALIASGADHAIARTMVLYGYAPGVRPNFVTWVIDQLQKGETIRVVDDQFGNPTLADELATAVIKLAESNHQGIYHISGSEVIDRYSFAVEIARTFKLDETLIQAIKTKDLNQLAPRPLKSGFIIEKAEKELGITMSGVKQGLQKFKKQYSGKKSQ